MTRNLMIGIIAGLVAAIVIRWTNRPAQLPPGTYRVILRTSEREQIADATTFAQQHERIRRQMNTPLPGETSFNQMRLADVFSRLAGMCGVNLHIDWAALAPAGFSEDARITALFGKRTPREMIETVLEKVHRGAAHFWIENGVIRISTREHYRESMVLQVHNVGEIIERELVGARSKWASGQGPINPAAAEDFAVHELMGILKMAELDQSERESFHYFGGQLFIRGTPEAQQEVSRLLEGMRKRDR